MKSSNMRIKTQKGKILAGKEAADIMWRDCQWNNNKGIRPFFVNHVPDYSIRVKKVI